MSDALISPKVMLSRAVDSMLWNMYAYRFQPLTEEEYENIKKMYKPCIDKLIEEIKNG